MDKEIAKELRTKFKVLGYNNKMVSVKVTDYSIDVIIKNMDVDYRSIGKIVNEYNSRSIIIDYPEDLKENLANSLESKATEVFNIRDINNCLSVFAEDDNYKVFYNYKDEQLLVEDKKTSVNYVNMIEKFEVRNITDIKYALMRINLRYKIAF